MKVGEVFVDNEVADSPCNQVLANAVREVLDKRSYMKGITYNIEYVECTTYASNTKCYKADDVYRTLAKMGVASVALNKIDKEEADIWFAADAFEPLSSVKEAISEIKAGRGAGYGAIKFRPEQDAAIKATVAHFKKPKGKAFLWNAKMRFGKTLSGLQVAKEMGFKSTLIITHRPVVDKGWHDDFKKIFGSTPEYSYATRMSDDDATGGDFYTLKRKVDAGQKKLIFFVSMQYLRLSKFVGGKERNEDPLKKAIMQYDWDFVMVDEAHEGIEAAAGVRVMDKLKKDNTRILSLSGTPFNLLDKYEEGEIYTWDYVMEQTEKQKWDDKHFGDPNPYADLPRMQILTFTLPKMVRDEAIQNNEVFKFHEFFRVWTEADKASIQKLIENETSAIKRVELQAKLAEIRIDKFIHEGAIKRFLDKLVEESDTSQYPFSTEEFRNNFKHTFWLLPGVKEAAALKELLDEHDIFGTENGMFHIINAAGDGNIEDKDGSALADVEDNIRGNAAKNITKKEYTITLSCGKLTTGVSVPEWTAVLCMKGSENTPAANYMQTIFRVQTHAVLDGRQKSDCYVFDFAPDRALTAVAETAKMAVDAMGAGKKQMKRTQQEEEEHLQAFIKLCPVLSMDEGEMGKHFSANQIFEKLSNVYIERAVRSGYADNSLYNPEQLMNLTPEQEKALGDVHDLLGSMPASWKPEKINVNDNGLGDDKEAEMVKFIFFLSPTNVVPTRPAMSAETDDNNRPCTDEDGWSEVMSAPSQMFPYLFISKTRLIEGTWTDFSQPTLWKEWTDPKKDTDEAKKKRDEENKEKRARMSVLRGVSIRIPLLVYGAEILLEYDDLSEKDSAEFKKWAEKKNIDVSDKSKLTPKEIEDVLDWLVDVKLSPDYFTSLVDDASWEEFMPKGFTKETFNILKDCFDRSIFTGAAKRIRQMVKEADDLNTEDRINKIATIFSYFHNPDKETVLTPWRVVNMHMSDCLGGWCFLNEEFDGNYTVENEYGENINAARFVDRGQVTKDVFGNYNARVLEINSKTGLYPLYMAYSIFKNVKEPEWRGNELTGERGRSRDAEQYYHQADNDLLIWRDVLQDNIFVVCRTKMAVSITKRTLAGFQKDIRMNVKCYEREVEVNDLVSAGIIKANDEGVTKVDSTYYYNEHEELKCDMITVFRAKPELFQNDIVQGKAFWNVYNSIPISKNEDINNMRFSAIVGNPPYQIMDAGNGASDAAAPIYNKFVENSQQLNPKTLSMIMPSKWMVGGRSELSGFLERMKNDCRLSYIKDFRDDRSIFPSAHNDGGICYFRWDSEKTEEGVDYNYVTMDGEIVTSNAIKNRFTSYIIRDTRFVPILEKVFSTEESLKEENRFSSIVSKTRPFGIRKDIFNSPENYPDSGLNVMPFDGSVHIHGVKGKKGGAKRMEGYVKRTLLQDKYEAIDKYKVFFTTTYSSDAVIPPEIIRGYKEDACTETFLLIGPFDTQKEMENCANYIESKFFRFLLFLGHGTMQVNQSVFGLIPLQDFTHAWKDIDLYKKYGLSKPEIEYIERLINPS